MRRTLRLPCLAFGILFLLATAISATAQTATPCGTATGWASSNGLTVVNGGAVIYDSGQGLCWLADANLAGDPFGRAAITLSPLNEDGNPPVINPDGTMDWYTALNWVNGLNSYNNGAGWLGHNNWQLPSNPAVDPSCTSFNVDNFGALCTGSGMGYLYNVALARTFPNSVVPWFPTFVWPFFNLSPGLYWARDPNGGGQATYSFNTGKSGGNTTKYNFLHVLPMTDAVLGPIPAGSGVLPYLSGPGAGRAVYDTYTGKSWTLNANLPAYNNFGFTDTTTIMSGVDNTTLTLPMINKDGAVYFSAVDPGNTNLGCVEESVATTGWIVNMNSAHYAGSNTWRLPCISDLQQLHNDMMIAAGDIRLEWPLFVGPFLRLQPGFYWACSRTNDQKSNSTCNYAQPAPQGLEWSFNFDDGFEGTDLVGKQFYVMVNYPAPQ